MMMNLVELYYKLEEKWFAFVDSVSEKGIPLDRIVDRLEQSGIPTFPLLITVILFGIYFSVLFFVPEQPVSPTTKYYSLTVQVMDQDGKPIQNALISIGNKENYTNSAGKALFQLKEGNYTIHISKSGCENTSREISLMENKILPIILTCAKVITPKTMDKTLILTTPEGTLIDSGYVYVYKKGKTKPETYRIENGKAKIHLDEDVWKVEIASSDGLCTKTLYKDDLFTEEYTLDTTLDCQKPEETVILTIQVVNESLSPIKGVPVKLENNEGLQITVTKTTNEEGTVEFSGISKGMTVVIVASPYEEYLEKREELNTSKKQEIQIVLSKAKTESLSVITVVNESGAPVKNAKVLIYTDNKTISQGLTNSNGEFKVALDRNKTYSVTVYKNGHYIKDTIRGGQNKTIILDTNKELKFGSLTVYVYLRLETGDLKTPANTYVYLKDANGVKLPLEKEVNNGVVRFKDLPEGTYIPVAVRNGVETSGESVEITEDSRKTVKIYLEPLEFQLIVYVKKGEEAVPRAHVTLYQGETLISEASTEIDGAAYFFVKEQLDYTIEAEKEIEGSKYIGKEIINGYEITHDLERTIELMAPDYDIIYKGVSEHLGGPFQKNASLDIKKKYYIAFQLTAPEGDERVEIELSEENITVLSAHFDLEDECDYEANNNQITIENCSEKKIGTIKYYIQPNELGNHTQTIVAEFYKKDELMKKKKLNIKLSVTTACKIIDNKYICLNVNGSGTGVLTKPYNITYTLETNYDGEITYEHTCSDEKGRISEGRDKITVVPLKTGECSVIFKANYTEILKHKYVVSSVYCRVDLQPDETYVNGLTTITVTDIITDPEIDISKIKVENVTYPDDEYSGLTEGDVMSKGSSFELDSGKRSGYISILWSINLEESEEKAYCYSGINVNEAPLTINTTEITGSTEKLLLRNKGEKTIKVSDVSLVYPEEDYEVSLNCYDEDLDEKLSPGENMLCTITEAILEKLGEYSQGETERIWVFVEYDDTHGNTFLFKKQITFNVKICEERLEIKVSPTEGIQGKDINITLTSAEFVNKFCEGKVVKVNLTECDPGLCTLGNYELGDTVLKLNGSDTIGLDKITLTFEYNKTENITEITFVPQNILQVKLSSNIVTINKDSMIDAYNGIINANLTIESATFNGKEVEVTLVSNGRTGAAIKKYKKGDIIHLTSLPVTDSATLEWKYYDSKKSKWYQNTTTITFEVSGKLKVSVSPNKIDANKTSQRLNVNATFLDKKTQVILEDCIPKNLCLSNLGKPISDEVLIYPKNAKDYSYVYLYWKLEVPRGSDREFNAETILNVTNSTCGEFVELEKTILMKNESNEYTINITYIESDTHLSGCENAECSIINNNNKKLILKNVTSNNVTVEFKKDTCIALFKINILNATEYLEKLYSEIPKVVNKTMLENIINLNSPKEIAEKFNNGTTYNGEYFNNQYFLAKLVVEILNKSDKILDKVFNKSQYAKKCEGEYYNLSKEFQVCEDGFVLRTFLRNITIGHIKMTNQSFFALIKKLINYNHSEGEIVPHCDFNRIVCTISHRDIKMAEKEIACGVYDIEIVINCSGITGGCIVDGITFTKTKNTSCNTTVNNFVLFLGQTQIANPPEGFRIMCNNNETVELYTNFSGYIGMMYNSIIGMYDSCNRFEWNISKYSKINIENGSLYPSRDSDAYPHLFYIIPTNWSEGIPESANYRNYVSETLNIYKQYDASVLVMRIAEIDSEIAMFFAGNISRFNILIEYYTQGELPGREIDKDGKVLVIGKKNITTSPETMTADEVLFRALTDCYGINETGSNKTVVMTAEDSGEFYKAVCIQVNGSYQPRKSTDWTDAVDFLNNHSGDYNYLDKFVYNGKYAAEAYFLESCNDECDKNCSNMMSFVQSQCSYKKRHPCDLRIVKNVETIKRGKKYEVRFKLLDKEGALLCIPLLGCIGWHPGKCEMTISPLNNS